MTLQSAKRYWLPGPRLRLLILFLVYAFVALALTVNFAYSTTFFLLAIVGVYIGFRRGFVNGIERGEKLVMLAFAACLAVAIISYVIGFQTNVGFRILGRDLRFLLFIPVYLAIRWARPQREHAALALTGAAVGACIMAALSHDSWPRPQGATGTHIVFGDLALLSGCLGAALTWRRQEAAVSPAVLYRKWGIMVVAIGAGVTTSILAKSGGGWLALPILAAVAAVFAPLGRSSRKALRLGLLMSLIVIIIAVAWLSPPVRSRITAAVRHLQAYQTAATPSAINASCVDRRNLLEMLLRASYTSKHARVSVVKLSQRNRDQISEYGCRGDYALELENPASNRKAAQIGVYRGRGRSRDPSQSATILARGSGQFNVGWKSEWLSIQSSGRWGQYTATGHDSHIRSAIVLVPPGGRILFVPVQEHPGEFIYPLVSSSATSRIAMWLEASRQFLVHPWFGVGTGGFRAVNERHGDLRLSGNYEHAHSDYFTSLATKGIVGFIVLILLFSAIPVATAIGPKNSGAEARNQIFFVAMVFATAFATFSLTETMFIHSQVISWYGVVSALILSLSRHNNEAVVAHRP